MCKAKMAVYMLLDCVGRSPYRWEAPEECALVGTLYMCVCLPVHWEKMMSRETSVGKCFWKDGFTNVRSCLVEDRSGSSEVGVPGNSGRPKVDQLMTCLLC